MYSKLLFGLILTISALSASATTTITGTKDYGGATVGTSCDGQSESQQPVFLLTDGATIKNVVIKAGAAADGIHCTGSCTLSGVKWPDVCEDAATMKGGSGKTMTVSGGSAYKASDKVFQHNGIGSTIKISGFAADTIGKLYRSCGNCSSQGARYVTISSTKLANVSAAVVGINSNYGDKATITSLQIKGYKSGSPKVCATYQGNNTGAEPTSLGEKWNTSNCVVSTSNVTSY
ncbi:pectate lyase [Uliginosibacterium sp. 31-16]|uniref:pectate lyase n=1 Tax=Uliginosibacterium sp. 31-16 TaxID=3068315 RepID=UPI00273DAA88|nr:pectate lyase [Uliginosibacterium sp. 31-16]MDP5240451.1 pectate lyase [Uliginosibacterium sp. 31-16]